MLSARLPPQGSRLDRRARTKRNRSAKPSATSVSVRLRPRLKLRAGDVSEHGDMRFVSDPTSYRGTICLQTVEPSHICRKMLDTVLPSRRARLRMRANSGSYTSSRTVAVAHRVHQGLA